MWDKSKGKKTIAGSVAAGAVIILWSLGLLTQEQAGIVLGLLTMWTGVSLRLAISDATKTDSK